MFVCLAFGLCLLVGPAAAGFQGHGGYVKAVALALDGRRGLSGDPDMLLRYWSLETDEELRKKSGIDLGHAYFFGKPDFNVPGSAEE